VPAPSDSESERPAGLEAQYEADLRAIILERLGDGFEEITAGTPLLEMGILDSLMMQHLLAFVEDRYAVMLPPEEVRPEKFGCIRDMARVIRQCGESGGEIAESGQFEILNGLMESYGLGRRWVSLPGGRHHLLTCSGSSPPLVFLPGLGSPASSWGPLMRSLRGRQTALALDLAGFGVSEAAGDAAYSFRSQVERTVEVLDHALHEPGVLVGSSAGGMIAAEIARRRPDLCRGLVLVSFGQIADPRAWWADLEAASRDVDLFWNRAFSRPPPLTSGMRRQMGRTLSSPAFQEFLDEEALELLRAPFRELTLPTMFVAALEDRIMPPESIEAGARQVPGARFEQIARCGHFVQFERSQELLVYLQHFLQHSLDRGAARAAGAPAP
jgi:pimeloyl-ACP methyl ester carboxylesterase/acyl carrier protein